MFLVLVLILVAVPFIELFLVVQVWQQIGVLETLLLLLAISVTGAWLVKREGLGVWERLNKTLASGRVPTDEIIDGACILFAGALMLTPGFLTDALGLLLLVPPARAVLRRMARRRFTADVANGSAGRISFVRVGGFSSGQPRTRPVRDVVDVSEVHHTTSSDDADPPALGRGWS